MLRVVHVASGPNYSYHRTDFYRCNLYDCNLFIVDVAVSPTDVNAAAAGIDSCLRMTRANWGSGETHDRIAFRRLTHIHLFGFGPWVDGLCLGHYVTQQRYDRRGEHVSASIHGKATSHRKLTRTDV